MGRPSVVTAEIAAAIEATRKPGSTVTAHHRRLTEAGVRLSRGTLDSYLRRGQAASTGAVAQRATAALGDGTLAELQAAAAEVATARKGWVQWLDRDARSVRAYAGLTRLATDLARAVAELQPPPAPDPANDPACIAAKARLLAMVDEVLAR